MVLSDLLSAHGYWLVAAVITLESMGIPLPGETTLVTAAVYAGTTHHLKIGFVIAAAAIGAIVGDNAGFWVGRRFGVGLLHRYGHLVRLDRKRISLGQHLFERHGGKVVFFGRFVAVLRTLAALLAGVNGMEVRRFLIFNATGGIVWATVYGVAAYVFGEQVERLHGALATVGLAVAVIDVVLGLWIARKHEQVLAAHADRGGSV
jgi:membrane protein DedA with SNARE-associated domain